ncbi:MAG TPA: hypothetical protein VMD98_04845 [Bryocella sp.]|nr:hypothetical protein [Bryocella sp.]
MNLLIDNNNGLGPQDYTAYVDGEHLPLIARALNSPATMGVALVSADTSFTQPANGARVVLQRSDGFVLFTGYLAAAPEQEYLGYGQNPAWRYLLHAVDDSCRLDHNELPSRTSFVARTAGNALTTLANDVLPGGLDESGVQDVGAVNEFQVVPQKTWTAHAQELALMTRAIYWVQNGALALQEVGQQSFTLSESDPDFSPAGLTLTQPPKLLNDITVVGELEPQTYVRDYFLGDGTTLEFYLSQTPFGNTELSRSDFAYGEPPSPPSLMSLAVGDDRSFTIFSDDYSETELLPTLWSVTDPNNVVSLSGGQLQINGGPATIVYVEQVQLAGGLLMQHGIFVFNAASQGTVGGIYNGAPADANCIAGFSITPNGGNSNIQALIDGSVTGPVLTTTPGHQYSFKTELICSEVQRVQQTYLSSLHPAGDGRGGDAIPAALRVVLSVHDVDPNNPGTLAVPATVLYDNVVATPPSFATYALINGSGLFASVSYTGLQRLVNAEIRSMVPNGAFRTRLAGSLADGGECYLDSSATLCFYAPYPPQLNEQIVVAYRTSGRAMARVQDAVSIAEHAQGGDKGARLSVRRIRLPLTLSDIDAENAACALLDDTVQTAWQGQYKIVSDYLAVEDVIPGNAVQVSAPSRGANFSAIVRKVEVQVVSLADDRSQYEISFANDADESLAFKLEAITLPAPVATIYTAGTPSSSLYIPSLTSAAITNVIASQVTIDAGVAPPAGGGIEVRRSDGGWGPGNGGNLVGRFTTETFTLPRLSRAQSYYLRQYDGSSPAKYSRYSALLYVDYPL